MRFGGYFPRMNSRERIQMQMNFGDDDGDGGGGDQAPGTAGTAGAATGGGGGGFLSDVIGGVGAVVGGGLGAALGPVGAIAGAAGGRRAGQALGGAISGGFGGTTGGTTAGVGRGGDGFAALGGALASGVGAFLQSRSAEEVAQIQSEAARLGISEQEAARLAFQQGTEPFRQLGLVGAEQLTSFLQDPTQQLAEINPVVDFLRQQGFEQIQESAAARGRLGAGGTLQDLTRFETQLASTIVPQLQNQRFNQLFNVAGLGANVAAGQGTAGLNVASNIGNLLGTAGRAEATGQAGQTQAILGGIQNLAGVAGAFPNLFGGQQGQQVGVTPVAQPLPGQQPVAQSFPVAPPPTITGQPLPPATATF